MRCIVIKTSSHNETGIINSARFRQGPTCPTGIQLVVQILRDVSRSNERVENGVAGINERASNYNVAVIERIPVTIASAQGPQISHRAIVAKRMGRSGSIHAITSYLVAVVD